MADAENGGILFDFEPPPRRLACPILDCHVHAGRLGPTRNLVAAARDYAVTAALGICWSVRSARLLDAAFPGFFRFAIFVDFTHRADPRRFQEKNERLLESAAAAGIRAAKIWAAPQFNADYGVHLHDPLVEPVLRAMARLGFACIVHVSDPDAWFAGRYADAARFGTKEQNYVQLEEGMRRHRDVLFQGAHVAGDPEHLDHVARLLDSHPNLVIDTGATKWVSRELGRQPDAARQFVTAYADRMVFGTDAAVFDNLPRRHHASRYWVHQVLWETDYDGPSPIYDPDGGGRVRIRGLNLPGDVLEKLYFRNAVRLGIFGSPAGPSPFVRL